MRFGRFSILLTGLLLLLSASGAIVHAGAQEDARSALARALRALDANDPRSARVELMNAIKADPKLAEARVAQARALLMLGNGIGAQAELDRAEELGVKLGAIRDLLAHAALLQGRPEDAIEQVRAPDADPREALFRTRLEAQALQMLGKYDDAARAFDRAQELNSKDPALWADIGRFNIATGDMAKALAATDRAIELAPNGVDALTLRALMAREQYGLAAAALWFERALAMNRDYVPALTEYAATLADLGNASRALSLTRRALTLAPGLPRAYYIQAVIAARAERYDLARSLIGRMNGAFAGQAGVRLLKGVLQLQVGNATLAAGELAPLVEAQPLNIRARLLLARAYYDDGQYGEAEKTLFPIVERDDAGSYALILAARIHEAIGDGLGAEFIQRASALTKGPSDTYRGAGEPAAVAVAADADRAAAAPNLRYIRALLQAGEGQVALVRARSLAAANPGAPAAWVALGDCLMMAGRFAEAGDAYERAGNMRFRGDVALRLIEARQKAGDDAAARRVLGLFLAQNPMSVDAQRLSAAYLLAAGRPQRGLMLLESLRARLGNEDALLMADIARARVAMGDAENALPYAAHAYRLLPMSAVAADIMGWTLFKAGKDRLTARALLEKAARIAPEEPLVRQHLAEIGEGA